MKNTQFLMKLVIFLTALSSIFAATTANAAPGDLDTTFGVGGKVRTAFGGGNDAGSAVAIQTDGKVVVAGEADDNQNNDFLVVRYNTDGSLDQTFGEGGKVVTFLASNGYYRRIYSAVLQPDGKILIGGTNGSGGTDENFVVIRYNADGSLDSSFGSGGIVTTDFSGSDSVHAFGLLTDGRILAVGGTYFSNNTYGSALARYNANGSLDTTFGSGGKVTTSAAGAGTAFAFVDSTRFVVAGTGTTNNDLTLARYNGNGSLDTTFGTNGIVISTNYFGPEAFLTIQSDIQNGNRLIASKGGNAIRRYSGNGVLDTTFGTNGTATVNTNITGLFTQTTAGATSRILVSGSKNNPPTNNFSGFTMTKLFNSGTPDTAFGSGGTTFTALGTDNAVSRSARLRSNRIVQIGFSYAGTFSQNTTSVAYNLSDGSLDTTFDADGIRTDDFGTLRAGANGTAIQADGKIIAVGDNSFDFTVVRYNQDGTQDNSFGAGGKVTTNISGTDSAEDVVIQPDRKIIVGGKSESNLALVRYLANGALDTTFGPSGIVTGISGNATAIALQVDGKIVAAGTTSSSGTDDFAVVRYNANGTPDTTFGTNGSVITGIGTANDGAYDLKIQPDGKIVVAGFSAPSVGGTHFALVRYNLNGTLDQTFGSFGKSVTDIEAASVAISVALQADGKIVAAGYYTNNAVTAYGFAVTRYLANGTLDTTFDGDGIVTARIGIVGEIAYDVAIQTDGKIFVVGDSYDGSLLIFAAIRFNTNGSLDNSYGIGGKVAVDFSSGSDGARAVALDSSGRAVIAGNADGRFALIRLLGDMPLSQTYEGDVQSRPIGDGFVDSDDIQQIRRFSVGNNLPYQSNEFQRADCAPRSTSGDGYVDGDDVQQARRFSVGTDGNQIAGGPASIAPPAEDDLLSEIIASPFGKQTIRSSDKVAAAPAAFRVDNQNTSAGATLMVPIRVDTVGNEAGYTFSIAFDSMKLTNPQVVIGNGGGDVIFNANNPGQIGFSVTSFSGGTIAAANNVALVNVTFTVAAGAPSGTTPITFTDTPARRKASGVDPNNPITQPTYTGGTITISGATAADANVSGRVLTAEGRGIRNAQVKMTDTNGETRTVLTSAFGYFRFTDVAAGQTYIISAKSKRFKFAQATRVLNLSADVDDVTFIAVDAF